MSGPLHAALTQRERDYTAAIDRLRELAPPATEDEVYDLTATLRECVELSRCLRRLTQGLDVAAIHAAFGAPGDFGYESAIGDALARTYRGEP